MLCYVPVVADSPEELAVKVERLINNNHKLQGGVSISAYVDKDGNPRAKYSQAVIVEYNRAYVEPG